VLTLTNILNEEQNYRLKMHEKYEEKIRSLTESQSHDATGDDYMMKVAFVASHLNSVVDEYNSRKKQED
jgi:hypothetical protein